ncbi:MAG: hypothetical protein JSV24_00150 [Bacteroidales bacterium]|nr:MAG: hypothetical protein JSV24_00150 [Bacteroidales bacterium]
MLKELIIQNWKGVLRSPNLSRDTRSNIFIGILVFIMILNFFFLGFFFNELLMEINPDKNPLHLFNSFILYYLLVDLFARLVLQSVPGLSIQPYLHLNIGKSVLSHYLLFKSLGSIFNYIPFAIVIPFSIRNLSNPDLPGFTMSWIAGIFLFLLFNAYLAVYVKRRALDKPVFEIGLGALIILSGVFDYYNIYSVSEVSGYLFRHLLLDPVFIFIPLSILVLIYGINFHWLKEKLFIEQLESRKTSKESSIRGFSFLDKWGEVGMYIQLEMKLIFRNKRLKQALPGSLALLLLGFVIYRTEEYRDMMFFLVYMGIIFTGMFMIYYGQFVLAWESHYFDKILTERVDLLQYLKAKQRIMQFSCILFYIIMLPFALFGDLILYVNTAVLLFNLGINTLYLLWTGTSNRERLDLDAGYFTWQGKKGRQIGIAFMMIIFPLLVYLPVKFILNEYAGLIAVGITGIAGLLFSNTLLVKIKNRLMNLKYDMAEGYRQTI